MNQTSPIEKVSYGFFSRKVGRRMTIRDKPGVMSVLSRRIKMPVAAMATVIAPKESPDNIDPKDGLPRRYAPRNDKIVDYIPLTRHWLILLIVGVSSKNKAGQPWAGMAGNL
jgi:hypothetical protein